MTAHPHGSKKRHPKKHVGSSMNGGIEVSKTQLKKQVAQERLETDINNLGSVANSQRTMSIVAGGAAVVAGVAGLALAGIPIAAGILCAGALASGLFSAKMGVDSAQTNDRRNRLENPDAYKAGQEQSSSGDSGMNAGYGVLGALMNGGGVPMALTNMAIQGGVEKLAEQPKPKNPVMRGPGG